MVVLVDDAGCDDYSNEDGGKNKGEDGYEGESGYCNCN